MTLDELMQSHDGKWENDIATVRQGAYLVQVAKKINEKIELTEEGLRSFPELSSKAVPAPEKVLEEKPAEGKKPIGKHGLK